MMPTVLAEQVPIPHQVYHYTQARPDPASHIDVLMGVASPASARALSASASSVYAGLAFRTRRRAAHYREESLLLLRTLWRLS